ncbi:MAG: hypothetical protein ABSE56_06475 [Bryobacteraceae bacterium]|jgi:hypothetical protein
MKANWERIIREKMEPVELIPGQGSSVYKVRGSKTTVSVLTDLGDFPPPMPPLDRYEMSPAGGREVSFEVSDPDFLVVDKTVGVAEYAHYIPWEKIADIVFRVVS